MSDKLYEILTRLNISDDQPAEEFDPEKTLGDLKDKVDSIRELLIHWEGELVKVQRRLEPLLAKKKALMGKYSSLERYVKEQMIRNNFEKIPGNEYCAKLQNGRKIVEMDARPSAELYLQFPDVMKQEIVYSWKEDAILEILQSGAHDFPFAKLKQVRALHWGLVDDFK